MSLPETGNLFAMGQGKFSGYKSILTSMIQQHYVQPEDLPSDIGYAVMCQLIIDDEGNVLDYRLLNSSGNPIFDDSALAALTKLTKVRKPPQNMERTIVIKFFPPTV